MKMFFQAFDSLKSKPEEEQRPKSNSISCTIDEQYMTPDFLYQADKKGIQKNKTLSKSFYQSLSAIEQKFETAQVKPLSMIDQLVGMYQDCVQAYDAIQDPIKYYFVDKIKYILSFTEIAQPMKPTPQRKQHINPEVSYFREFEDFTDRIDKPTEYSTPRNDIVDSHKQEIVQQLKQYIEEGSKHPELFEKSQKKMPEIKEVVEEKEKEKEREKDKPVLEKQEAQNPNQETPDKQQMIDNNLQSQQMSIQQRLAMRQNRQKK
ncbi:hypothetical protein pb186bvf_006988 [Paramecium bursaria]